MTRVDPIRLLSVPVRLMLALFAVYTVWTIPSLLPRWGASAGGGLLLLGWLALTALAWPLARDPDAPRRFWPWLIATALFLRLIALWAVWGHVPTGDPIIYVGLAQDVLAGKGLLFVDRFTGVPFRALYPPAFPVLLAGIGLPFGLGMPILWLLNLTFDGLAAWLIVRIGARAGVRGAGHAAAWLYLVWPTFVLASPFAQKEPFAAVLLLGIVLCLLRLKIHPVVRTRDGALFGALAGLLALTQPGLATAPAIFGLLLLPVVGLRPSLALAWRSVPVALLVLAPWWIRNGLVLGRFVPLTTTGGIGLWIGNNPNASGNWMPLPPDIARLPELEQPVRAATAAKAWIAAHPVDALRLNVTKLFRTFGVEQFTVLRFSLLTPALPASVAPLLFPLLQGALFTALAAGAVLAGRCRIPLLLLAAVLLQLLVFDLWFEFAERHRYCVLPFLFLAIAAALAPPSKDPEPA